MLMMFLEETNNNNQPAGMHEPGKLTVNQIQVTIAYATFKLLLPLFHIFHH